MTFQAKFAKFRDFATQKKKHLKASSAHFSMTDYLTDLTWQFKSRTSGEVKMNANI